MRVLFEPNWPHMPGSKITNASFMHLRLRTESKEDHVEVGKKETGIGLQDSEQDYVLS